MPNILNILGFLEINDEESELEYFVKSMNTIPSDKTYFFPENEEENDDTLNDITLINKNINDLSGMRFGMLKVRCLDRIKTEKYHRAYWICDCECGNTKSIRGSHLVRNIIQSCGCNSKKVHHGDLTGKEFGLLKVRCIDEERTNKYVYYICDCKCGGVKSIRADSLTHGDISSCGCLRRKYQNLAGREFGMLKVRCLDEEMYNQSHKAYWICDCECGNTKSICGSSLINGKTTSCGCSMHHRSPNRYDLTSKDYGIGYTNNGKIFIFDKEDYDLISRYTWNINSRGYVVSQYKDENNKSKGIKMHRLVMNIDDPGIFIDHIHHNRADNRKSELRIVNHEQNMHNRGINRNNNSGHTGVRYNKKYNTWRAFIGVNGKDINLGSYQTKEDAIKAREVAEKKYYGDYRYCEEDTITQILNK